MRVFGEWLKDYRNKCNLSISDLSRITSVSQPYLSQLENDDKTPSLKTINKIAINLNEDYIQLASLAGYLLPSNEQTDLQKENEQLRKENADLKQRLKQIREILGGTL